MRRPLTLALLFTLCGTALFAADERWRVSVLASEISDANAPYDNGTRGGYGIGVAYVPNARWDVELMAAAKTYRAPYTSFIPSNLGPTFPALLPVTSFRNYQVRPLDLFVSRRFLTGASASPYVRLGVRYVNAPNDPGRLVVVPSPIPGEIQAQPGFHLQDRTSAEAAAGLRIRLTSRTALRVEAVRLLRSDDMQFDPEVRGAVGLTWSF